MRAARASVAGAIALGAFGLILDADGDAWFGLLMIGGGVLFAAWAPWLAALGSLRAAPVVTLAAFGVLFPVWGYVIALVGLVVGGMFGVPHAVITGVVLCLAVRNAWFILISVGALALAWVGAVFLHLALAGSALGPAAGTPPDGATAYLFAAALWHLQMTLALAAWADRRIIGIHLPTGRCAACGYDLSGLPDKLCPECGRTEELHRSASGTDS